MLLKCGRRPRTVPWNEQQEPSIRHGAGAQAEPSTPWARPVTSDHLWGCHPLTTSNLSPAPNPTFPPVFSHLFGPLLTPLCLPAAPCPTQTHPPTNTQHYKDTTQGHPPPGAPPHQNPHTPTGPAALPGSLCPTPSSVPNSVARGILLKCMSDLTTPLRDPTSPGGRANSHKMDAGHKTTEPGNVASATGFLSIFHFR